MASDILIVDDEADIREMVAGFLQDDGHRTRLARDSDEALKAVEERRPQLVILDIWLQGSRLDGLEVLNIIKKAHPDLPVVIISGHGNIETAVTAIKRGAYDYIEKPFKADRLLLVTLRALEASKLQREVRELRERSVVSFDMIGKSPAMNQLRASLDRVAPTNSRVLIRGGAGSGKELVARVMHDNSQRKDGPFVVLNAASMAPDRVEEELFGTEDHAGPAQGRRARGGARRHALHRRGRRHAAGDAGQGAARAGRAEIPARRRRPQGLRRRAHHLLDQPRPRARDAGGPLPRGPLPPPQRRAAARAGPGGAARRHPDAGAVLRRPGGAVLAGSRRARSARTPSPCCRRTTGRATCASSGTTSSA